MNIDIAAIQNKEWKDLRIEEFQYINDFNKREKFLSNLKLALEGINALKSFAISFTFSRPEEDMTIGEMFTEIIFFYGQKMNMKPEDAAIFAHSYLKNNGKIR